MGYVFSECLTGSCNLTVSDLDVDLSGGVEASVAALAPKVIRPLGVLASYIQAVARSDAFRGNINMERNVFPPLPNLLASMISRTGWIPIYCHDSEGMRNRVRDTLTLAGWKGKNWSQRMPSPGTHTATWYYGWTVNAKDVPAAVTAQAPACSEKAVVDALQIINDAKTYWGNPVPNDYRRKGIAMALAARLVPLIKCK